MVYYIQSMYVITYSDCMYYIQFLNTVYVLNVSFYLSIAGRYVAFMIPRKKLTLHRNDSNPRKICAQILIYNIKIACIASS